MVIALIVTPDGFPLAYEVMPGNTSDKTTLHDFLERIETQYGKARRTWVMDRGIPTEETLAEMRTAATPTDYLVGTPRGRLSQLEKEFLSKPWAEVRDSVHVKLVEQDGERYILARSDGRRDKEQAMRRRRLKKLVKRLHELRQQKLTRDQLLIKLGAARKEAGPAAYRLIDIQLPDKDQPVTPETFGFKLNWQKLREARRAKAATCMLDKMAAIQMVDVHLPTTDGRTVVLSRYTEPEPDQLLLLVSQDGIAGAAAAADCRSQCCRSGMTALPVVPTFR